MVTGTRFGRGSLGLPALVLAALASAAMGPALAAGGLEFSKDTIWEECYTAGQTYNDTVCLRNTTQDTLVVDTIVILLDTTIMPECQLDIGCKASPVVGFLLTYPPDTNSIAQQSGSCYGCPIRLAGGGSLWLGCGQFEPCIACPLGSAGATSEVWPGKPIWVTLVFLADSASDTLVVRGIVGVPEIPLHVVGRQPTHAVQKALKRAGVPPSGQWLLNGQTRTAVPLDNPAQRMPGHKPERTR